MAPTAEVQTRTVGCSSTIFDHVPVQLQLKEGGQIPGYVGHCPLLRYDFGKTFGEGTHDAYLKRKGLSFLSTRDLALDGVTAQRRLERPWTSTENPGMEAGRTGHAASVRERSQDVILTRKGRERRGLPEYDGYNKYTENMVPGYTGYIPRYPFQFGSTYKEECDVCLDEHFSSLERQKERRSEHAQRLARSAGGLTPIRGDPLVRDRLSNFSGPQHPAAALTPRLGVYNPPVLDKACELPIAGYRGFIPRVRTTEIGLGTRYTEQTKKGLDSFYERKAEREAKLDLKNGQEQGKRGKPSVSTSSREISIDRSPVEVESATKWSSNCNGGTNERNGVSTLNRGQTYQNGSYVCERRNHAGHNSHQEAAQAPRVPKSVAFVV